MVRNPKIDEITGIIERSQKFILTTHLNPDGDAVGSVMAMREYLISLKKEVKIINISEIPKNYQFLDEEKEILVFDQKAHEKFFEQADAFIILDISDWGRLQEIGELIKSSKKPTICIDHHHIDYKFAAVDLIDEEASSTGELLFDFFQHVNYELSQVAAIALYTCILTDTGSFRFSNTTSRTHYVASQLLKHGIDTKEIYSLVYEQNSPSKMALLGEALSNMHYEFDGKLAWFSLTKEMFARHQASPWDTEGFPEIPRSIEGVEVSLMFTEFEDSKIKISLRSKGKIVIHQVAQAFGGGGHHYAAGAQVEMPLQELVPRVLKELEKVMN